MPLVGFDLGEDRRQVTPPRAKQSRKPRGQEDKSKIFQIFKLGIYQLHRIGDKFYVTKIHTKTTFRIKGVRKLVLFASEEERILSLSLLMVEVQL